MIPTQTKFRLAQLNSSILADALIQLAGSDKQAAMLVEQLACTPPESIAIFKRKLAGIKRRRRFTSRSESHKLTSELESLLRFLDHPEAPADEALKCLVTFFEADQAIMGNSDDSYGNVGSVFKVTATQAWIKKAQQHGDQTLVLKLTKKLLQENGYGVRDEILSHSAEFLSGSSLEKLYKQLKKDYKAIKLQEPEEEQAYGKTSTAKHLLEITAQQLKDPELYEQTCLLDRESGLMDYQVINVAQVYLDADKPEIALQKLNSLTAIPINSVRQHEKLLLNIHNCLGNDGEIKSIKSKKFLEAPSKITFEQMNLHMDVQESSQVFQKSLDQLYSKSRLDISNINFLLDFDHYEIANTHLLKRTDQIDGETYTTLPKIAEKFRSRGYHLAATHIYRKLLLSILERANTKTYPHGAKYLQFLQEISPDITGWQDAPSHQEFFDSILAAHGRKPSFWKLVPNANK